MANNAFDRQIINVRERPLSTDINAAQSQGDRALREVLLKMFAGRASALSDLTAPPVSGFFGDSMKVRPQLVPALSVQVTLGIGLQDLTAEQTASVGGIGGLDDLSRYKPLLLLADATITGITAGPLAGQDRKDIIEVRMNRVSGNPLSRDTLDTLTGLFTSGLVNKTLAFTLDGNIGQVTTPALSTAAISYKYGLPAGVGASVEPAVTPGYVKIATVFSNNGNMATVSKANIIDQRNTLSQYNKMAFSLSCSVPSGAATAPTLQAFNAPPGWEILIFKNAQPSQARIEVYLIGGVGDTSQLKVVAGGTVLGSSGTQFNVLAPQGTTTGLLLSGDVTNLANASLTANAQTLAVGTPYIKMAFQGFNQNAGVTGAPPDPMLVDIQGEIIRH